MEEVPWYWLSRYGRDLTLATPFVATAHLPLVALDDVGALAALAALRPGEFEGRSVDLAGDTATPLEIAARLTTALGEPVSYEEVQVEGVFVYQEASTQVHDVDWLRERVPRPAHVLELARAGRRARALPARGRTDDRPDGAAGGLTAAGRAVSGDPRR